MGSEWVSIIPTAALCRKVWSSIRNQNLCFSWVRGESLFCLIGPYLKDISFDFENCLAFPDQILKKIFLFLIYGVNCRVNYCNKGFLPTAEQDTVLSTILIIPLLMLRNFFFWCISACHFAFQVRHRINFISIVIFNLKFCLIFWKVKFLQSRVGFFIINYKMHIPQRSPHFFPCFFSLVNVWKVRISVADPLYS